ncbi:hypothetical protein EK904_001510 [Melospiza melodia maxima]|nr:hypothetical protein EK904_001510 [Melospiza melodia maxima]
MFPVQSGLKDSPVQLDVCSQKQSVKDEQLVRSAKDASMVWKHKQSHIHGTALSMIGSQMYQRKTGKHAGRTV